MNRFVHVGLAFPGIPKMRDLEPVMDSISDDWVRYSVTNWILWTSREIPEIGVVLEKHLDQTDQYLIAPIDFSNGAGRMSPWIWEWAKNKGADVTLGPSLTHLVLGYSENQ
jgi:hypothetical protein